MTSLHDRLADLAESAPPAAPSADLWEQGRRYGRRRRVEAATLTVVLLAAIGSLVGALLPPMSYDVAPADAERTLRLPDRIELPSPWAKGTDDVGPIGPVVAVFSTERRDGWFDLVHDNALAAVSASGDYAFLDLPDAALPAWFATGGVALSADGRWLAYPIGGETRKEPNGTEGGTATGLGVYDTVTGDVLRLDLPSDHGVSFDSIAWLGETVRFSYGRYVAGSGDEDEGVSRGYRGYTWDVTALPPRAVDAPGYRDWTGETVDGRAVRVEGRRVQVLPGESDAPPVDVRLDVLPELDVALSPSGRLLALREDSDGANASDGTTQPLRVATVPASGAGEVETRPVGDVEVWAVRGWRDDQHVVVEDLASFGLDSVDVETGAVERLTDLPSYQGGHVEMVLAQDALQAPTYDAEGAPYVMNPWLRLALVGLALLLAGLVFVLWRRRGRV